MIFRVAIIVLSLLVSFPAYSSQEYSSVVHVDISDESAAVAKEKAFAQANRQALVEVAQKMTNEAGMEIINALTDEQIPYFIKAATVIDEKSSNIRYIATFNITIQNDVLRQYLTEKGVMETLPENIFDALYIFQKLSDWLSIEKKIKAFDNVNDVEMVAMTLKKVQFRVDYAGELNSLLQDLAKINMTLIQKGNIYLLTNIQSTENVIGE